jgi:hypothetical protein
MTVGWTECLAAIAWSKVEEAKPSLGNVEAFRLAPFMPRCWFQCPPVAHVIRAGHFIFPKPSSSNAFERPARPST